MIPLRLIVTSPVVDVDPAPVLVALHAGDPALVGEVPVDGARIMGIDPEKVDYLRLAADLGHVHAGRIEQRGETVAQVRNNFALIDAYKDLRLA